MFTKQLTQENGTLTQDIDLLNEYITYLLNAMKPDQDNSGLVDEIEEIEFHKNLTLDRIKYDY